MEPSVLYSQSTEFDQRDNLMYLVLGLVSVSRHLASRLEAEAAQASRSVSASAKDEPAEESGDVPYVLV